MIFCFGHFVCCPSNTFLDLVSSGVEVTRSNYFEKVFIVLSTYRGKYCESLTLVEMDDSILAAKQILEGYDARVPKENDRVFKDECLFSFDSPVSTILMFLIVFILFRLCTSNKKLFVYCK